MLTPPTCLLEDPSVCMPYSRISSALWPSMRVNSAMKSATAYPFIVVCGRYYISNSLSLSAHNAIRPAALGLPIALRRGLFVKTIIVCA